MEKGNPVKTEPIKVEFIYNSSNRIQNRKPIWESLSSSFIKITTNRDEVLAKASYHNFCTNRRLEAFFTAFQSANNFSLRILSIGLIPMHLIFLKTTLISALALSLTSCANTAMRAAEGATASEVGVRTAPAAAAVAGTEPLTPSGRKLVSVSGPVKVVVNKSFMSPLTEVFGEVSVGESVFIASNTIVRADPDTRICIGSETNLQDNILFLALRGTASPISACGTRASSTHERVSIAHQAVIINSVIGNFTFVGFRSRIENAVLEDGAFVLHGATVANVRIPKDRIVPIGAVIKTQKDADALPLKTDAHSKFQKDVLHVNHEFAEQYGAQYTEQGFDMVTGVSAAPKTSFNPKQVKPTLGANVTLSEFTRIVGDVRIGNNSSVGRRTSIRADEGTPIIIGENAQIDDRVTFHALEHTSLSIGKNLKTGHNVVFHGPLVAGDNLNIATNAILFRSTVGNNVTIGERAIVVDVTLRDGVKVPDDAIITSQDKADALYWPKRN